MADNYFVIPEKEYRKLLEDSLRLTALESGGVDNWEWYGESIHDFLEAEEVESFSEIVDKEVAERFY